MEKIDLNLTAKTYFLNQGQSIGKLHGILYTHTFTKHLGKWLSVIFEILFYLLFVAVISALIMIPTDPYVIFNINDTTALKMVLDIEQLTAFMIVVKIIIAILSLPLLAFALLLGKIRRRNSVISKAFEATIKMKTAFDNAVIEIKL